MIKPSTLITLRTMTKSELWNEITTTYKYINNVELFNYTGKTYQQITKDELRSFYNRMIDLEIEVDEELTQLTKELKEVDAKGVNDNLSSDVGEDTVDTVKSLDDLSNPVGGKLETVTSDVLASKPFDYKLNKIYDCFTFAGIHHNQLTPKIKLFEYTFVIRLEHKSIYTNTRANLMKA